MDVEKTIRLLRTMALTLVINGSLFTALPNAMLRRPDPVRPDASFRPVSVVWKKPAPVAASGKKPVQAALPPRQSGSRRPPPAPPQPAVSVPETNAVKAPVLARKPKPAPGPKNVLGHAAPVAASSPKGKTPPIDHEETAKNSAQQTAAGKTTMPVQKRDSYDQREVSQRPVVTYKQHPLYPYRARRLRLNGEVEVKFLVDTRGRVSRISIERATPPHLFNDSVLAALPQWRFAPGRVDGAPVNTWVTTTLVFRVTGR